MFVAGIVAFVPLMSASAVVMQDALPHEFFVFSMATLVIWTAVMPLWGAVLVWHPDASKTSLSFASLVISCALPFAVAGAADIMGQTLAFKVSPCCMPPPSQSGDYGDQARLLRPRCTLVRPRVQRGRAGAAQGHLYLADFAHVADDIAAGTAT
jgi:hypothetical protein